MGKISKLRLTPTPAKKPREEGVTDEELATLAGKAKIPTGPKRNNSKKVR